MKTFILLLATFFVFSESSIAANCVSIGSGDWSNPAIWSCGVVPSAGDNITISVGHTVVVSVNTDMTGAPTTVIIDGILLFDQAGAKLRLGCGSTVAITPTGSVQDSGVGQPSHSIRICGSDVWTGPEGTINGPLVLGIFLPIELTFFNASTSGTLVNFVWQTASELNNDYFTIEGSMDGYSWSTVGRVNGAGTTSEAQDYVSVYENRTSNFSFFRLKQTDYNGTSSYSDVVAVEMKIMVMEVYPNPSSGKSITIDLPSSDPSEIQILDMNGKTVYLGESSQIRRLTIEELSLNPGSYIIQVQQNNARMINRLIVQ